MIKSTTQDWKWLFTSLIIGCGVYILYVDNKPDVTLPLSSSTITQQAMPAKLINQKTAALLTQQCVSSHIILGDYLSDVTKSPLDNLIDKCAIEYDALILACNHDGNALESCKANIRGRIELDLNRATGLY